MADDKDRGNILKDFVQGLSPEQADRFMHSLSEIVKPVVQKAIPPVVDRIFERLGYTPVIAGLVQLIAAKTNQTNEDVLYKALSLYGLAVDALEKDHRVAILDSEDTIVREVEGLVPEMQASP